jgi:hypothetical protein
MTIADIIIIGLIAAAAAAAIIVIIKNKKKGKGCSCGCDSCPHPCGRKHHDKRMKKM